VVIRASALLILTVTLPAAAQVTPAIPRKSSGVPSNPSMGKQEFEKGLALYQAGNYAEARPLFEEAYVLSDHRPTTIRAYAQCERMLENDPHAIELFEEYLATTPTPDDTAAIRDTITALEARNKARLARLAKVATPLPTAPPAPPAVPVVASKDDGASMPWGPIAITAGGAATLAGGVILFVMGKSAASNVEGAAIGTPFSTVRDDADRAPALMTAGTIIGAAGLAALGAGIVWWVTSEE